MGDRGQAAWLLALEGSEAIAPLLQRVLLETTTTTTTTNTSMDFVRGLGRGSDHVW